MSTLVMLFILFVVVAIVVCLFALVGVRFFGALIDRLEDWAHSEAEFEGDDNERDGVRSEQFGGEEDVMGRDRDDEDARVVAWFVEQFEAMERETPRTQSEHLGQLAALFENRPEVDWNGNRTWEFRGLIIEESAGKKIQQLDLGGRLEAMIESRRRFLKEEAPEDLWILQRELGEPYEEPPHPHWVAIQAALGEDGVTALWNEVDRLTRETAMELLERGSPPEYIEQDTIEEIGDRGHYLDRLRERFYPELGGPVRDHLDDQIRYRFAEQFIDADDFDLPEGGAWFLEIDTEVVSPLPGDERDVTAPSFQLELKGFGLREGTGVFLSPSSRVVTWSVGWDELRRGVTAADVAAAERLLEWAESEGPGVKEIVDAERRDTDSSSARSSGVLSTDRDGRMTPLYGFPIAEPPNEVLEMLRDLASRPFG